MNEVLLLSLEFYLLLNLNILALDIVIRALRGLGFGVWGLGH